MRNGAAMFNRAQNIVVNDGVFVVNDDSSTKGKLDRLLDEVAPNAILNAGGRADEVRCYPGTRKEVIGKIEKWMDAEEQNHRMMWLSGPAGAGKSAIVQTVAERCQKRGIHAANFFFFRGDRTRNHSQPLVPTLVYQLLRFYPALNDLLTECLTATPLAHKAATEEQFIQLISAPIQMIHHSASIHGPITIIVDGLDECADERKQEDILKALYALVMHRDSPFLVLVASRAEPNLVMSFNKIGTSVGSIFLDGEYRPEDDIRRFVIAKFDEIKRVHSLARTLDKHWPAKADINAITDKSSGQFIYAATVMRFIQYSPYSPAVSLLTVHGVRAATDHSPLAQLDAVYSYIFSKTRDFQKVRLILGAHFNHQNSRGDRPISHGTLFATLMHHGEYEVIEVESFLADLAPVVRLTPGPPMELVFYHASLSDYLRNKSRSGIYFVDVGEIAAELASVCLEEMGYKNSLYLCIDVLAYVERPTPEVSKSLLNASEVKLDEHARLHITFHVSGWWKSLMMKIYELYFESDRALYRQILRRWIRFHINNFNKVPTITEAFQYGSVSRRVYRYYSWYLLTERLMSAVKVHT